LAGLPWVPLFLGILLPFNCQVSAPKPLAVPRGV